MLFEPTGNLLISDNTLGLVTVVRSTNTEDFPTPTVVGDLDSTDDPLLLTVQETGDLAGTLNAGADPSFSGTEATAFSLASTGTCSSLAVFTVGQVCTYALNFDPTVVGPNTGNLVLTASSANGATATASANLYGIGLSTLNHFTLVAVTIPPTTPTTVNLGGSVELILTAVQSDGAVATDYTGTISFTTTDPNGVFLGGTTYTMTTADNGVLTIPSQINQTTQFTLTITTTGTVAPTGTVTFYSDGTLIGTETVTDSGTTGTASMNDSFPVAGSYSITATYTPSTNTSGGSASLIQTVIGGPTTISLSSSLNPVFLDNPTLLSAIILPITAGGPAPTGTVSFYDGGTPIGTAAVVNGTATLSASFVYSGTHNLTAVYSGSTIYSGITSAVYSQTVADFSITVASGGSSSGTTIAGGTTTYPLVVTPIITSTFPFAITLSFSGLPSSVTGTLTPGAIAAPAAPRRAATTARPRRPITLR